MPDRLIIRNLRVRCIVGTRRAERRCRQVLSVSVALECDLRKSGRTDRLEDTVNYSGLAEAITADLEAGRYLLIERAAERVADICLARPVVRAVHVVVEKPGAVAAADCAAVEIWRRRRIASKVVGK